MAEITHGIDTKKQQTSVASPTVVACGIPFVVGASPAHMVGGKVNSVIMANDYEEAVKALGYSDDWEKYGLSEAVYTQFVLYQQFPAFFVNVLDPEKHKKEESKEFEIAENQITLPLEAIADSVKIEGKEKGTDFEAFYNDTNCIVEFMEDTTGTMTVSYTAVDPSKVTKADIIGGYSIATHKTTGLELIDDCFPKYRTVPDLILCPNWSHDSEVAAVMSAKGENINGLFLADAILDVDTREGSGAVYYTEVPEWKQSKNFMKPNELVCFPKLKLGDRVFNYSTQMAGLMARTDNDGSLGDGTPCESSSNKSLQADSMVLASGEEVVLDVQKANFLNDNGVITGLNFIGGFVSWGDYTACFPANTDPVDYFYCISRMFKWVAKTVTLSYWSHVDRKLTRRLIDAILQGINDWLAALVADEKIVGGRVELREEENSLSAIMSGKAKFHIYITPPSPLRLMEYVLEYDVSYLSSLLAA